jgi:hypothetical protein
VLLLNHIFAAEGLSPEKIQLVRHKDARLEKLRGQTVFSLWHSDRTRFETYQSIQRAKFSFEIGGYVASFIVTNTRETVFVGLYEVLSRRKAQKDDYIFQIEGDSTDVTHEMRYCNDMKTYSERLVITPWKDAINYVKRASSTNPIVVEIRKDPYTEPFPTYMKFRLQVSKLSQMFTSCQERLMEAKGIYLLTFTDGDQYVGSASGERGFWQRWIDYAKTGNGGNRILIREQRDARDAIVSILEVTGSALTRQEVIEHEMIWKAKLGKRAKQLDDE